MTYNNETLIKKDFHDYLAYEKGLSANSVQAYIRDVSLFKAFFKEKDLLEINYYDILEYLSYLYDQQLTKSSQARKISSLKTFYKMCVNKKLIESNAFDKVVVAKKEQKLVDVIEYDTIVKFLNSFSKSVLDIRNKAIFELLYATGLRVSELASLSVHDIDYTNNFIKVLGKGSKERIVIFSDHTKECLQYYLNHSRNLLNIHQEKALFLNKDGHRLSTRGIQFVLKDKWSKLIFEQKINPHQFRHTFATHLLQNGMDLKTLQELLGHESLSTTQIYTKVSQNILANAVNTLEVDID